MPSTPGWGQIQMEKELWCELFMPWRNCPGNAGPVPGGNHITMGQNHLPCEDSSHLTLSPRFCLLLCLCLLCEKTASYWARFEQASSRMLSLKPWWPSTPPPPLSLSYTFGFIFLPPFHVCFPILPVCLPGSIKDPCVGLVTSYPALKELQDQPFTDDSVLVHQLY